MAAKTPKKSQSSNRAGSAPKHEAASIAASVGGDLKRRGVVIWPEWSDADINAEKWDVAHKATGKADKKQSPALVAHYYDDPDGKIDLPPLLRIHHWKRPHEFILDKVPVIVDPDGMNSFDLLSANDEPHESELIRWITGQIIALWKQSEVKIPEFGGPIDPNNPNESDVGHTWRPWEHIYAINKVTKSPNIAAYNSAGKYVVKLYWMGSWRKLVVDDTMPFDDEDRLLLPATTMQHELWPILLSKALIKIASLDYNGGSPSSEFGDFSVIHSLTGWLPETIPLQALFQATKSQYEKKIQDHLDKFDAMIAVNGQLPYTLNDEEDCSLAMGLSVPAIHTAAALLAATQTKLPCASAPVMLTDRKGMPTLGPGPGHTRRRSRSPFSRRLSLERGAGASGVSNLKRESSTGGAAPMPKRKGSYPPSPSTAISLKRKDSKLSDVAGKESPKKRCATGVDKKDKKEEAAGTAKDKKEEAVGAAKDKKEEAVGAAKDKKEEEVVKESKMDDAKTAVAHGTTTPTTTPEPPGQGALIESISCTSGTSKRSTPLSRSLSSSPHSSSHSVFHGSPSLSPTRASPWRKRSKPKVNYSWYGHLSDLWELLRTSLPEFKLPEPKSEEVPPEGTEPPPGEEIHTDSVPGESGKGSDKPEAKNSRDGKKEEKKEKKEEKKEKKGDKGDKGKDDKNKEKSVIQEELPLPEHPEVVVFASYSGPPKYPMRISILGEMADASERLRQSGLSHLYPHPVLLSQTRACPLEPPAPAEVVPLWKLIRPKKKKTCPSDEPIELEDVGEQPIQCVEITSPFINYKVSPIPIPIDVSRPKSSLTRGQSRLSSRPGTANAASIEEMDENAPLPPTPPLEELPQQAAKVEDATKEHLDLLAGDKPCKGSGRKQTRSGTNSGGKSKDGVTTATAKDEVKSAAGQEKKTAAGGGVPKRQGSGSSSHTKERGNSNGTDNKGKHTVLTTLSVVLDHKDAKDAKNKEQHKEQHKDLQGSAPISQSQQGAVVGELNPLDGQPLEDDDEHNSTTPTAMEKLEPETRSKNVWMDFEDFCKCFKTLYVYHKPHTYLKNTKYSDLKSILPPVGKDGGNKDKKSTPNTAAGAAVDDKAPHYLFVDSLERTEIVVSLSSLSRWPDPPAPAAPATAPAPAPAPAPPAKEEKAAKNTARGDRDSKAEFITENSSVIETPMDPKTPPAVEPLQPGLLVAEPYSWKSLVTGQPILRLRSTATRAAVLALPAGRHVLRFSMTAPLGYHVHLSSATPFVFGDEEAVMVKLTEESCRFVDNATQVLTMMGRCIQAFSDPEQLPIALEEYHLSHCPYLYDKNTSKLYHNKVFQDAMYAMLKKVLSNDATLYTNDMATAWKAFNFDCTTKNPLGLTYGTPSRPATGVTISDRGSATRSKGGKKPHVGMTESVVPEISHHTISAPNRNSPTTNSKSPSISEQPDLSSKLEHWKNREVTPEEHVSAVKVQKNWRGYWVRKIKAARTPGTEDNAKVQELLQKAWTIMEPQTDQLGLTLFRTMFKADPDLMPKYPFYRDEWNKVSYADYQGSHPEQQPNTWFVLFREIFHVQEEMLVVPKLYVPIHTCLLRVVNNDTGEEMPRVFQKVVPYFYKKNKRGYTFVAEARTLEQSLPSGRWRLRLIGSLSPLPTPARPEVNSSFHTRELRDYYLPNDHNVILRYSVRVLEEQQVSLQLATSKSDVYCKLSVLDHGVEVASAVGKGHVVLPAVIFSNDGEIGSAGTPIRLSARGTGPKTGANSSSSLTKTKRVPSAHRDGRISRSSSRRSTGSTDDEDDKDLKLHKYIIQAVVLRNSWPLSEPQWTFVQMLKEMEKNELKVSYKERPHSATHKETKQMGATKPGTTKGGKGAKGKDKGSRPVSQQFDFTKPNWLLRVVSDGSAADDIDVRKDTERADEIRAMKKAWEEAEPGRAAKALQSRLAYLQSHLIKKDGDGDEDEADSLALTTDGAISPTTQLDALESELNLSHEPPPPPEPKEFLKPLDISPYLKKADGSPRLRDQEEVSRQDAVKQAEIQEYRRQREDVERQRQADRAARNQAKIQQIQLCETMQAQLDSAREAVFVPREVFRQKFLEAERLRLEEIAVQEAALRAELEKSAPSPKGRKSAKGKKSPAGKKKK